MSSSDSPHQFGTVPSATDDDELPTYDPQRPSIVKFKEAIDYGIDDPIRSVVPVAKYFAVKHPGFVVAPALPRVFDVEFEHRELARVDGDVEQRTTLTVYYGEGPVQETLGTITICRKYRRLPDMAQPLDGSNADDTSIKYSEAVTP